MAKQKANAKITRYPHAPITMNTRKGTLRYIWLLIATLAGLTGPVWAVPQCPDTRHQALLIANGDYPRARAGQHLFPPLRSPSADLKRMRKLLRDQGYCLPDSQVLKNATRQRIERTVENWVSQLPNDATAIFYYSGHAVDVGGTNYLIPTGQHFADEADVRYRGVPANWILKKLQTRLKRGTTLMILDACRDHIPLDPTKGAQQEGLAPMSATGALVAYATRPGYTARGNRNGGPSPFTEALVAQLEQHPRSPIEDILRRARTRVVEKTQGKQIPWADNLLIGDEPFCLSPRGCRANTQVAAIEPSRASPRPGNRRYAFHDTLKDGTPGPEMMYLPPMTFRMGDLDGNGDDDEKPVRTVHLDGYAIGRYEVTNAQYVAFLNAVRPSDRKHKLWLGIKSEDSDSHILQSGSRFEVERGYANHPVQNVTWHGAQAYVRWLSDQTGQAYRLPTEAEWEAAARAGTQTKYSWGNQEPSCTPGARNGAQYFKCQGQTVPVGTFSANPFGLYDLHGNVSEWVADCYQERYDPGDPDYPLVNPLVDRDFCSPRVFRGGSWDNDPRDLRSANRNRFDPFYRYLSIGFRVARPPP